MARHPGECKPASFSRLCRTAICAVEKFDCQCDTSLPSAENLTLMWHYLPAAVQVNVDGRLGTETASALDACTCMQCLDRKKDTRRGFSFLQKTRYFPLADRWESVLSFARAHCGYVHGQKGARS